MHYINKSIHWIHTIIIWTLSRRKQFRPGMRFPTIFICVDSDEPLQPPFKLRTPNGVHSVA